MSPAETSVLLAVAVWARIPANPLFAHLADRGGRRRTPIILLAWASLVIAALYCLAAGFTALLLIGVLLGFLWSPIMPLGENLVLLTVYRDKLDYGRIRVWGSISFMLATIGGGFLLSGSGTPAILALILAAMLLNAVVCHLLPEVEVAPAPQASRAPLAEVLGQPLFLLFLLGSSLEQASHGVYYAFSAVYWRSQGLGGTVIGLLWAEGVIAEILLFFLSGWVLVRVGPLTLLLMGGLAGILRWTGTAASAELWALVPLQALHGLTFGAAHLGAMHFLSRAIPADRSATAQSLYSTTTGGIALGLALLAAGPLYGRFGANAFLAMAALSAVASLLLLSLKQQWSGGLIRL